MSIDAWRWSVFDQSVLPAVRSFALSHSYDISRIQRHPNTRWSHIGVVLNFLFNNDAEVIAAVDQRDWLCFLRAACPLIERPLRSIPSSHSVLNGPSWRYGSQHHLVRLTEAEDFPECFVCRANNINVDHTAFHGITINPDNLFIYSDFQKKA